MMSFLGRAIKFWLLFLLVLLSLYIAYYNGAIIPVRLPPLIESVNMPAFLVYIFWLVTGSVLTWGFLAIDMLKKSWQIRRLTKQVRELGGTAMDAAPAADQATPYTRRNDISVY